MVEQIIASKEEYTTLYTFRAICEQTLDYKGIDKGRELLYKAFPDNKSWVEDIISDYMTGERMTEKLKVPDKDMVAIIETYEVEE